MRRIYKSRKRRRNKTRKKKVFRKRKFNKKSKRRKLKRKKRTKRGGSVRRKNAYRPNQTVRVANKWVAGSYGPWIGNPHFINWGSGLGRQSGTTSIAVRFINRDNGGPHNGRVHLYGTALPQQTHPEPIVAGGIIIRNDPRDPVNWAGPDGLPPESRMYRTLAYFMYGKGVKKWISHQGCSSRSSFPHHYGHHADGGIVHCQGNPGGGPISRYQTTIANTGASTNIKRNAARAATNTWRAVRQRYPQGRPMEPHGPGIAIDPAWTPLINETIQDMTPGRMETWHRINQHVEFENPNNSTVIHCLAGWGRTGSTLFFYILRNWFSFQNVARKKCIHQRYLGAVDGHTMYNNLRQLANKSFRWDDMHSDAGTTGGRLPGRVTIARPIDRHLNAHFGHLPPGRGPNGDWESPAPLSRTSDLVHEVFALRGRGGNLCSDIFITRINYMIVNIWIYLYLTDYPGSIDVASREANWHHVFLYRKPSAPYTNPDGTQGVGWPATTRWNRCVPKWIFGTAIPAVVGGPVRDPAEWLDMFYIVRQMGLVVGQMDGHLTKHIPPLMSMPVMNPVLVENTYGLQF